MTAIVVIVGSENDNAKHLYSSQGGMPGKPERKSCKVSCKEFSTSRRALFQSPGISPKVNVKAAI